MVMTAQRRNKPLGRVIQVQGADQPEFDQQLHRPVHRGPAEFGIDFLALCQNLTVTEMPPGVCFLHFDDRQPGRRQLTASHF